MDEGTAVAEGRYLLVARIGAGGMASVFRAWDTRLRVWRAVKVLERSGSSGQRARFEREAHAMARLRHPAILAVHDVGETDGQPWLVMDLARHGSLADLVARVGPLAPRLAVRLVATALDGLQAAHEAGIVHRDVKPHNILLGDNGQPLVADFGIARLDDAALTATGAALGTLVYMAPEQRRSAAHVDARADVYAAAGTLYALLTGREPTDLFLDRPTTWEGVPDALIPILRRASAWEPDERHPSAAALGAELRVAPLPAGPVEDLAALLVELPDLPIPSPSSTWSGDGGSTWAPSEAPSEVPPPPAPVPTAPAARWLVILGIPATLALAAAAIATWAAPDAPLSGTLVERRISETDLDVEPVEGVAIDPDGQHYWYATEQGVWRGALAAGHPAQVATADALGVRPYLLVRGPDGSVMVEGSAEAGPPLAIYLWPDGTQRAVDSPVDSFVPMGDGTRFVGFDDGLTRLLIADEARVETDLGPLPPGQTPGAHEAAPDGRHVAVGTCGRFGADDAIWVKPTDGGDWKRLASGPGICAHDRWQYVALTWIDATTLAYAVRDGNDAVVRVASLGDGSDRAVQRVVGGSVDHLSWGGGRLAYLRMVSNEDVWRGTLGPDGLTQVTRLTRERGDDAVYGVEDDGATLLRQNRDGRMAMVARAPDGTQRRISPDDGAAWRALGDRVALRGDAERLTLERLDANGWTRLAELRDDDRAGCGREACVIGRQEGATLVLDRIDLATGARAPLWSGPFEGTLSADVGLRPSPSLAKVLLLRVTADPSILDVASGTLTAYHPPMPSIDEPVWSPDESALFVFGLGAAKRFAIYRHPLDGSPPTPLYETASIVFAGAISPDGRTLAWSENRMPGEAFVLESAD